MLVYLLEISWQAYLTLKIGEHPGLEIVLRTGKFSQVSMKNLLPQPPCARQTRNQPNGHAIAML